MIKEIAKRLKCFFRHRKHWEYVDCVYSEVNICRLCGEEWDYNGGIM